MMYSEFVTLVYIIVRDVINKKVLYEKEAFISFKYVGYIRLVL